MAYLEPNGTIQLFENIPIDSSYRNTFWFDSLADQTNYFSSLPNKHSYPKCYYTRKNRGYVRVKDLADNIYKCNYMRYNNLSHHNKWIYCFITSVDYINENTAQVNYEIDLIQTYMFDVKIRNSFVERQHSFTDEIGDNLIEEDLGIGNDYIVEGHDTLIDLTPNRIAFITARQLLMTGGGTGYNKTIPAISVINGVATRTGIMIVRVPTTAGDLESLSQSVMFAFSAIDDNEIPFIFMYNKILDELVTTTIDVDNPNTPYAGNYIVPPSNPRCISSNACVNRTINTQISVPTTFGSYQPKNKKLLTYPYKYFVVNGADHDEQEYKYELFTKVNPSDPITFYFQGAIYPFPQYMVSPKNYYTTLRNHTTPTLATAYEASVHINDYVTVPYSNDVYKAYLLQTRGSRGYTIAKSIIDTSRIAGSHRVENFGIGGSGTAFDTFTSGPNSSGGAFSNATNRLIYGTSSDKEPYEAPGADIHTFSRKPGNPLASIGSMLAGAANAKGLPNNTNGSFNSDGLMVGAGRFRFEYFQYCIKPEYAKIIDDFFTAYGYAQKEYMGVISPSSENVEAKLHRRKLWNYTKTRGCNVISAPSVTGCTADEIDRIADIYDNGITFWQNYNSVGSYVGDNSPRM